MTARLRASATLKARSGAAAHWEVRRVGSAYPNARDRPHFPDWSVDAQP